MGKALVCSPKELELHSYHYGPVPEGSSAGECQHGEAESNKIEMRVGEGRRTKY